ncbi:MULTISPECIES: sugar phosphate isomerase/epimerase [Micrococcaceae]|uniref:sugar phosphate isomerase/epimerase family protein n=1 Tax=Micrococcaceae TaxID=1268 RepID=UPI001CFFD0B3|nr:MULTISPECIES: sugar phosphate isomerase/epimerase [Micrococcaceae]MCB5283708.1 hypothetical protein [Arthrobacter sp. ES1]WGZ80883.1 sugar phosphate isomerase/epimerase [Arthrobacter sp. EM1]
MQFGFSSFTFRQCMRDGRMSLLDVMDWISATDATHMEIATVSLTGQMSDESTLDSDPELIQGIKSKAADTGLVLSNLVAPANFLTNTVEEYKLNMERTKRHILTADELGIRLFRHDVATWATPGRDIVEFESLLPRVVEACQEIAQFGAQYGITTSVENHGLFMNASERVRRLIYLVDEPNFRTTVDVGNFLVVDEDASTAVARNAPYASIFHLKDFYVRHQYPGEGWIHTDGGAYLLGAIVGYGDLDMRSIVRNIVASGYDGFISLEFEGIEDCLLAATTGLANMQRLFAEV